MSDVTAQEKAHQYDGLSRNISKLMITRHFDRLTEWEIASISFNCSLVSDRLMPEPKKEKAIAIVGFGPSLKTTWEELKTFDGPIFTVSKSHDYLAERCIMPTYHLDCDPKPHKLQHVRNCHPEIQYLMCSAMHPSVILYLKEANVPLKLWNYDIRDCGFLLPEGEWGIPIYADSTQQAMQVASILGYKEIHLFGVDYSHGPSGEKHADKHEGEFEGEEEFTCNGESFRSHWEFVKCMMQMPLVLNDNPDINVFVHGDSLLYSYLKDYYAS